MRKKEVREYLITAAEDIKSGDAVCINGDGKVWKCRSDETKLLEMIPKARQILARIQKIRGDCNNKPREWDTAKGIYNFILVSIIDSLRKGRTKNE